jgi:hypothetical protein
MTKDINYYVLGDVFDPQSCQSVVVNETVLESSHEANTVELDNHSFIDLPSFTREHSNAYGSPLMKIYICCSGLGKFW